MAEEPLKPNLAAASCDALYISAWFRVGRRALADYADVAPRTLLSRGAKFRTSYADGKQYHVADAKLRLIERYDDRDAAERWSLTIHYAPSSERPGAGAPAPKPFARFMKNLGKLGLETDAFVRGTFRREGQGLPRAQLPVEGDFVGGAFNHVIGYTLARLGSDLNDILYEVSVRRYTGTTLQLDVQFAYRATLAEAMVGEIFDRATTLADIVAAPVTQPNETADTEHKASDESDQEEHHGQPDA